MRGGGYVWFDGEGRREDCGRMAKLLKQMEEERDVLQGSLQGFLCQN